MKVPPQINELETYTEIIAHQDDDIEMNCSVSGYPLPKIEWKYMRTNSLVKAHHFDNTTYTDMTSYLVINNVTKSDKGNYSCGIIDSDQMKVFALIIQSNLSLKK
jgi:hypothetical protein